MCSNTSSSVCGCGTGGNGASIWSSSLKKQQKRPRIPKRGPGVAELEKILREQETIDLTDKGEAFPSSSFVSHHSNPYPSSSLKSHYQSRPSSPGRTLSNLASNVVPSVPKFDPLGGSSGPPSMTSMFGGPLGRNCGSGLVSSSEKELFPVNLNLSSCKFKTNLNEGVDGNQSDSGNSQSKNLPSESNPLWPFSAAIQNRNNQFPPPKTNQFLGAGTPTSSGLLPIGVQNHTEPPSNQNSFYNYTSRAAEEHKILGMKRSHPPSLENTLIPPSNFPVLPSFSHYNRSQQSSINDSHCVTSFNSTKESYRDPKWGNTLELSNKRVNSDIVIPGYANFPPFVKPEVPPPPSMHLFGSVLSKLPCQASEDKMEGSHQRSESSGPDHKPFYNFLEVEGPGGVTEGTTDPIHGGREGGRGGMDLSLKL